jgi:uncharacterized membrane protein
VRPETLGALIDAIYAVAITMLALEIPSEIDAEFDAIYFGNVLMEYAIAFAVLFAFWLQHRRINGHVEQLTRGVLWLNALVLLLVCLVPRATTLIFAYGDDVTVVDFETALLHDAAQSRSALVDGLYVLVVFVADAILLLLTRAVVSDEAGAPGHRLRRTKVVASVLLTTCLVLSVALPYPNRYFALLLPLVLFFEEEVTTWLESHLGSLRTG